MGYSVWSDIINTHDKMRLDQNYFRILLIILLVKVFSIPQLLAGQDIILKVKILQDLVCVILQLYYLESFFYGNYGFDGKLR